MSNHTLPSFSYILSMSFYLQLFSIFQLFTLIQTKRWREVDCRSQAGAKSYWLRNYCNMSPLHLYIYGISHLPFGPTSFTFLFSLLIFYLSIQRLFPFISLSLSLLYSVFSVSRSSRNSLIERTLTLNNGKITMLW